MVPTRVLLVDDQPFFLDALESRLTKSPEIQVVGRAGSGEEALEATLRTQPDVVLMDLRMPGMGGHAAVAQLKLRHPTLPVVVLTVSESEQDLLEAVLAGAAGYLTKGCDNAVLVRAIRALEDGASMLPSALLQKALRSVCAPVSAPKLADPLTERETEVLQLLAKGLQTQEICDRLSISRPTTKKHIHNIIRKLSVSDRTQAVLAAIRLGLAVV